MKKRGFRRCRCKPGPAMVEVLLDRIDGQEVPIVDSNCIPGSPTKCSPTENSSAINEKLTPIQKFYYGQSIFLTGGTGFMGKLLIEKLLRTCSGVASIYLLVRPKKGKDVHQRTEEIFDDPVSLWNCRKILFWTLFNHWASFSLNF